MPSPMNGHPETCGRCWSPIIACADCHAPRVWCSCDESTSAHRCGDLCWCGLPSGHADQHASTPKPAREDATRPLTGLTRYEIKIVPRSTGTPALAVADAEVHFTEGVFHGLKLIGFTVWLRRARENEFAVTFPARSYSVNGERRSFALLRPAGAWPDDALAQAIIDAYRQYAAGELAEV